jgi:hypothetical protein
MNRKGGHAAYSDDDIVLGELAIYLALIISFESSTKAVAR